MAFAVTRTLLRDCPICRGPIEGLGITVDYGVPALNARISVGFAACGDCSFVFQQDPVSFESMTKYYQSSPRYRSGVTENVEAALYASQAAFMERDGCIQGASVLDIGADMGKLLDVLVTHGCSTWFMESNLTALEFLTSSGRHRQIERLGEEDRFDLIVLSEVYEHIVEPVSFLRDMRWHLNPGGRVFIEVPCHTNWDAGEYGFSFEHVNYFSTFALSRAFRHAGFYASHMEVSSDARYFDGRVKIIRAMIRPIAFDPDGNLPATVRHHHAAGMGGRMAAARQLAKTRKRNGSGLALYGAAELADLMLSDTRPDDAGVIAIFDTDPRKHGNLFHGLKIQSPDEIPASGCSAIMIMSSAVAVIRETIANTGFAGDVIAWNELEGADAAKY